MWQQIKCFFGFETIEEPSHTPIIKNPNIKANAIRIHTAESYDDSAMISKYIKEGEPIILNVNKMEESMAHRLLDFVCGSTFAINGHIQKLNESLYLFSPEHLPIKPLKTKNYERNTSP